MRVLKMALIAVLMVGLFAGFPNTATAGPEELPSPTAPIDVERTPTQSGVTDVTPDPSQSTGGTEELVVHLLPAVAIEVVCTPDGATVHTFIENTVTVERAPQFADRC